MALIAGGCASKGGDGAAPAPGAAGAPNFELRCSSSDTRTGSTLFCMRHDTRTGDVKNVAVMELPVTRGSTKAAPGGPGKYTLTCEATRSEARSDVYCVRLDTETGDMMLIALPKVGVVPEGAQVVHDHGGGPHQHEPPAPAPE